MNIFVGNLSFEANEMDLQRAFAAFGVVTVVAIVMEKKGKKSRGFGFVEMPDEQEALAAIAQLNGQEILGRPVNVMPALSKEPKSPPARRIKQHVPAVSAGNNQEGFRHNHSFKRTGKYKEGRRSLSFMKKRLEAGITAPVPERRYKPNPMRWRKKPKWQVPFTKPAGEFKPWQRPQTESNPWKKPKAKSGDWKKTESDSKPWQKIQGEPKPPGKNREGARPWKKTAGQSKPWRKSGAGRGKPGLKKRGSFKRR